MWRPAAHILVLRFNERRLWAALCCRTDAGRDRQQSPAASRWPDVGSRLMSDFRKPKAAATVPQCLFHSLSAPDAFPTRLTRTHPGIGLDGGADRQHAAAPLVD